MSEESGRKSAHDMRQGYATNFEKLLLLEKEAFISGRIDVWARSLMSLFSLAEPYMKDRAMAKLIGDRLESCKNSIDSLTSIRDSRFSSQKRRQLENELFRVERLLMEHCKELMLPVSGDEEDDLTLEGFMEGSDL